MIINNDVRKKGKNLSVQYVIIYNIINKKSPPIFYDYKSVTYYKKL